MVRALWIASLALGLGGCSATDDARVPDRLGPVNRAFFVLNGIVDGLVIRPASQLYVFFLPETIRQGVSNALGNAFYLDTVLNDLLQGKLGQGGRDAARFLVNTTAGVGGLIDVASSMGLEEHDEDFGQTLATWGVPAGSYFVVPLFGPSTLRDAPGIAVSILASPLPYVESAAASATLWSLYFVVPRSEVDPDYERRNREAEDPYAFTREAWLAHRAFLIHDGNPPVEPGEVESILEEVEALDALDELEALEGLEGLEEPE